MKEITILTLIYIFTHARTPGKHVHTREKDVSKNRRNNIKPLTRAL